MPATEKNETPPQSSNPLFLFNDDDFGDFEFATPISHSSSATITASIGFDDEEWGDFIEVRNNRNGNGSSTAPSPDPGKKVSAKPMGAIPLSVFGEEDVEDADLENSRESDSQGSIFESYKLRSETSVATKGLGGVGRVEIKDLVFGLYGQAEEEKKKKVDSNGDVIKGSSSHEDFDEDDDDGGWEFKDAKSDTFNVEGIQVLENGVEHVLGQNSLLKTNDHKQVNGGIHLLHDTLSNASQLSPSDFTTTNSFFDMKHDIEKDVNLEDRTSANMPNKDFSTSSRLSADDLFFYSSPSSKSTAGYGPSPKLDNDNKIIGTNSNGVPPDLWDGNDKNDDYDGHSWEFKDAPSDMFSEHESQDKVHMKNMENFCLEPNISNDNKDVDDAFADVPGLFVGAISIIDSVSKTSNVKIDDESFCNPSNQTSANEDAVFSKLLPIKTSSRLGSGSIIDILDDLYGEANNLGVWKTGDHSNEGTAGAHMDYLADDLDDSSWEFKDALPDLVTSESSQQDKDSGQLWENHVDKPSTSTVQNEKQEVDSLLNISDEHLSNPSSEIVDTRDIPAFDDVLFDEAGKSNCTEAGHNTTNVYDIFSMSYEEKSYKTNNYLKSDFLDNEVNQSDASVDAHEVTAELSHESFLDFYSKLKEMSCLLVVRHLDDLKNDHELIVLSGEEDKAMRLHQEIQTVQAKLQSEMASSDNIPQECLTKYTSIHKLLESIHKPYLQALEIEYGLTEKIFQAEKNLGFALSLLDHSASMLRTLNAASCERQRAYIVAWSKLFSTCARELEHGAEIWMKCCLTDLCSQIISETQGFEYFLALGEIYRVVEVLTVSLKIYKPWLLLNASDLETLFISVKKCSNFWVNSGLENFFQSSINLPDSKNKERSKSLLESIETIRKLDPLSFQNYTCGQREPFCQLSLLPLQKLQDAGMEIVVWSGATYFVKLANLWANRISCEPPSLPPIKVG